MNPLRLRILESVTAALSQITAANGFQTDVGANVFRGRAYFGDDDPLPMISMIEPPVSDFIPEMAPAGGPHRKTEWTVIIQGFVKNGTPNPCDPAYIFSSEVCRVLAEEAGRKINGRTPAPFGFETGIEKVRIGSAIVRPSDNISATAYFWLGVVFEIVEDLSKPMG